MSYKAPFVIGDPVERSGGADDFLFGICSHTERSPENEQELEIQAAAAAGATVMRLSDAWAHIEPKPGEWHWETQDRLVALAARYGIETQPILGFTPSHAIAPALRAAQADAYKKPSGRRLEDLALPGAGRNPVSTLRGGMATRYKGESVSRGLERPDLASGAAPTEDYLLILRTAYEELRRAILPRVASPAVSQRLEHQGRAKNPDLQELVLSEARFV